MTGFIGPRDTEREADILKLVSEGKSYSIVAEMLGLYNEDGKPSRNIVSGAVYRARKQGTFTVPAQDNLSHTGHKKIRRPGDTKPRGGARGYLSKKYVPDPYQKARPVPFDRLDPVAQARELAQIKAAQVSAIANSDQPLTPDGVTIMELQTYHCRRPLGSYYNKTEFYCGKPRMDVNTAYCLECHRVMYRPYGRAA